MTVLLALASTAQAWTTIDCTNWYLGMWTVPLACDIPTWKAHWNWSVDPAVTSLWPAAEAGITKGFRVWEQAPSSSLSFQKVSKPPRAAGANVNFLDNHFTVDVGSGIPWYYATNLPTGWLAVTALGYDGLGTFAGADILLNDAIGATFLDIVPSQSTAPLVYSTSAILAHEFGHVLHLDHSYNPATSVAGLMLPAYPPAVEYGSVLVTSQPWVRGEGKLRLGEDEFLFLFECCGGPNAWHSGTPGFNVMASEWGPGIAPCDPGAPAGPTCHHAQKIWPDGPDLVTCPGAPLPGLPGPKYKPGTGPFVAVQGSFAIPGVGNLPWTAPLQVSRRLWLHAVDPAAVAPLFERVEMSGSDPLYTLDGLHTNENTNLTWIVPAVGLAPGALYRVEFEVFPVGFTELGLDDNIVVSDYLVEIGTTECGS